MLKERKDETKLVKNTLIASGLTDVSVTHGKGTAWSWLHVKATTPKPAVCICYLVPKEPEGYYQPKCDLCNAHLRSKSQEATELILKVTGRYRGDYDGNTNVDISFKGVS
jgi:hypothetical protein